MTDAMIQNLSTLIQNAAVSVSNALENVEEQDVTTTSVEDKGETSGDQTTPIKSDVQDKLSHVAISARNCDDTRHLEQSQIADSTVTERGETQSDAGAHEEAQVTKCPQEFREYSQFDEAMEDEDFPLPSVIAEDNPEWSAMIEQKWKM